MPKAEKIGAVKAHLRAAAGPHGRIGGFGGHYYGNSPGRDVIVDETKTLRRALGKNAFSKAKAKFHRGPLDNLITARLPGRKSKRWSPDIRTDLTAQKLARKLNDHGVKGKVVPVKSDGRQRYHDVQGVRFKGKTEMVAKRPKGKLV